MRRRSNKYRPQDAVSEEDGFSYYIVKSVFADWPCDADQEEL